MWLTQLIDMGRSFLLAGKSFLLTVGLCCLQLKFVLVFLLTVEIRVGLFCLRCKLGLVFFTYGSPCPEIRFGLFCLRFAPSGNWVWSFLLTVPPP